MKKALRCNKKNFHGVEGLSLKQIKQNLEGQGPTLNQSVNLLKLGSFTDVFHFFTAILRSTYTFTLSFSLKLREFLA